MINEYIQYLVELIPKRDSLKLVKSKAEKYYKSHSIDDCFDMGIKLYQNEIKQVYKLASKFLDMYER